MSVLQRKKPTLQQFGLPKDFDFNLHNSLSFQKEMADERPLKWAVVLSGIISLCIFAVTIEEAGGSIVLLCILFFFVVAPSFILGVGVIGMCLEYFMGLFRPDVPSWHKENIKKVSAYRKAVSNWEYTNLETGEGWWRKLRGIKFENAIYDLISRRGGKAFLTKASDDGGVDLVVKLNGKEYWIQAKGYSTPIGVAPVREIAGVCSLNKKVPILAAVNGYTKRATEAAKDLNVGLIDSKELSVMASKDNLSDLYFK